MSHDRRGRISGSPFVALAVSASLFGIGGAAQAQCPTWLSGAVLNTGGLQVKRILTLDPDGAGPLTTRQVFLTDGGLTMWDGQALTTGTTFNSTLYSACVFNNQLAAGGAFRHILANDPNWNFVATVNPLTGAPTAVGNIDSIVTLVAAYPAPGNGVMSIYAFSGGTIKYWNGATWVQVATINGTPLCATTDSVSPGDESQCQNVMRLLKTGRQFRCHVITSCGELFSDPATILIERNGESYEICCCLDSGVHDDGNDCLSAKSYCESWI